MKNETILEMLNNNEIEALKKLITQEIYNNSLERKSGYKNRCSALKRYYRLRGDDSTKLVAGIPYKIENSIYITDGCGIIKTSEDFILDIYPQLDSYIKIERLFGQDNMRKYNTADYYKLDFNKVIAMAKAKGYKLTKDNLKLPNYLVKINDTYINIAILDINYSVINNGDITDVKVVDEVTPVLISNDIGMGLICPIKISNITNKMVIIDIQDII